MSINHTQTPIRLKIFEILRDWKRHVPNLNYNFDSRGNISMSFRGIVTRIVFTGTVAKEEPEFESVNCGIIPPYDIYANLPLESTTRDMLLDYGSKWFHGFWISGWNPQRRAFVIRPQAVFTENFLCLESLYHALVEITSGYWELAKVFYKSGLLQMPPLDRVQFEERIASWEGMKIGYLKASIDRSLPTGHEMASLLFNNLIGDKPGSGVHIPKQMFDVPEPFHHDVYCFKLQDLAALVEPVKEMLEKQNKEFEFGTLHQGFPLELLRGHTVGDYHGFLGLRFSVQVADEDEYAKDQIEQWKHALVFAAPSKGRTDFGRYTLEKGHVRFNINIPLYTDKNHRIIFTPKLDSRILEREVLRPAECMKEDIDRCQRVFHH
jgi:hypothetical protein